MLCVTGSDRTATELKSRVARHREAPLQEVRLDLLQEHVDSLSWLEIDPKRLLITCRPRSESGEFTGSEDERLALLESLLKEGPGWIDIELSCASSRRRRIIEAAHKAGTRIVVSHHAGDPVPESRIRELFTSLASAGADTSKLAVAVDDAADLAPLWRLGQESGSPVVLLGTGTAGLLSRALYPRFGSSWTYAASRTGSETSAGQYSVEEYARLGLPPGPDAGLYVLLGGPQILRSPGPGVYNALFSSYGISACYLPVITRRPAETLKLLLKLGLRGASVTMPLKREIAELVDTLGPEAMASGVVNTVTVESDGRLSGALTDGQGALAALNRACGPLSGKRVLVLGSGATAAAVVQSLVGAGGEVTVLGRDRVKAETLAARFGIAAGHLQDLPSTPFEILVHTTPVGSENTEATLVKNRELLRSKVVLDAVLERDTRLLRDARTAEGVAVSGRTLWAEQGRLQLKHWLNLDIPSEELEVD